MGISKDKQLSTAASELRRHAEEQLHGKMAERHYPRTDEDTQRVVHELEVHKIELMSQNAELRKARNLLEELNSSLEAHIVQALEELRQKDQMLILKDRQAVVGEMVNNIAHQWLQPLNALGLVIQKLPLFYDTAEFNRQFLEEHIGKSMELIQHMSRTVNDFSVFFRPDKKKHTFNIDHVIERTLSLIGQSFQDQHVSIAFDPEGGPVADGYPNEYAQVLLNILMNARDALVEHHVDGALISMHAFTDRGKSVVIISDNGGGIAEEIIDQLFDPYFTTKGPDKGTGIGLFMSKIIIEKNMGGRLSVRNSGNGAEFRIEV